MLFKIFVVLFISNTIYAAPKPQSKSFNGDSVNTNYNAQYSPFSDLQNSFLQAALLPRSADAGVNDFSKQLGTNSNDGIYDAKTLAAFAAAFGDKSDDKSVSNANDKTASTDNANNTNVVNNPFSATKDIQGKLLNADSGLPGVQNGKLSLTNAKTFSLVPSHGGNGFDPLFGVEVAPRFEIQYAPHGHSFNSFHPFAPSGWNGFPSDYQPNFNTAFGQHSPWDPSSFPSSYPHPYPLPFPALFPSDYPLPNNFIPGLDPKGLKPKDKDVGGKGEPTTESAPGTTSENSQPTSEPSTESSKSDSPAETTSESASQASA